MIQIQKETVWENTNHRIEHAKNPAQYHYPADYYQDENRLKRFLVGDDNPLFEIIAWGYVKSEEISAWEHTQVHQTDDIEDYVYKMAPLICEIINNQLVLIEDGNHRLNTLQKRGMDVPVVVLKNKLPGTRLRYLKGIGVKFQPVHIQSD